MIVRKYNKKDIPAMIAIWNEVVEEGVAFPQEEFLDIKSGEEFFASQSYCGVAVETADEEALPGVPAGKGKAMEKATAVTAVAEGIVAEEALPGVSAGEGKAMEKATAVALATEGKTAEKVTAVAFTMEGKANENAAAVTAVAEGIVAEEALPGVPAAEGKTAEKATAVAFTMEDKTTEEAAAVTLVTEGIAAEKAATEDLSADAAASQVAGEIVGLYILHPNNIGRCGHISNASYAVRSDQRGKHVGELLVKDCLAKAKELGFGVLQFNAVVESNVHARHLYERLGFVQLGTIPRGFRMKDGHYENICPYYHEL